MSGSVYGKIFTISTWGESHGETVGVCVDGVPAGLDLSEDMIQSFLDRRKPGQSAYTTQRKESDTVRILSGIFEGKTTGTPVAMLVENTDQHSKDYSELASLYRPGHADFTFQSKYGIRDYRGGGRSSGRETIGRVAAGAIASGILNQLGINILTYTKKIGSVEAAPENFDFSFISENPLYMPDRDAARRAEDYLKDLKEKGDSAGGIIECVITGLNPGIGEPVFDKLDACLAKAVMSIGAVKGFEIGAGFEAASMTGSQNNDAFTFSDGKVTKTSNNSGGTLGGMSDGSPLILRAAIKPTPSISLSQETVNLNGEEKSLNIKGRHDPVIVPRAVVVVEAMAALTLVDLIFENMSSRMDYIKEIYLKKG